MFCYLDVRWLLQRGIGLVRSRASGSVTKLARSTFSTLLKTSRSLASLLSASRAVVVVGGLSDRDLASGLAEAVATGATATPMTVQTSTMLSSNGSGAYEGDAGVVTISIPADGGAR